MPRVRVYNENIYTHEEMFRDELIKIPVGGFIEMDEDEAHLFFGQYKPPIRDAGTGHDPRGFKKLRMERIGKEVKKETQVDAFQCMSCNKKFKGKETLDFHIAEFHAEQIEDKEFSQEFQAAQRMRKAKKEKAQEVQATVPTETS